MPTPIHMTPDQKNEIATLFSEKHLSCNQLAKMFHFSRPAIHKFLKKSGYDTTKATGRHVNLICKNCGQPFSVPSSTWKYRKTQFCSTKCYYEFIKDGDYKPWRHGQRIARYILTPFIFATFGESQEFIAHHKDGNDSNNEYSNLMAFISQSDHLAYHRHHRIVSVLIDLQNYIHA